MLFSVWLKFNDAQERIGLTKYKYLCFTSLSEEWVSSFKNTGDFIIRALCNDHVIAKFRWKQNSIKLKSISTHKYYWPTRRSKMIHPRAFRLSTSGTLFSVVSLFFGVIMAPKFKSIAVVSMCEQSCSM